MMSAAGYYISTDKNRLNIDLIHEFLSKRSYWAENRTRETVVRSIQHSFCFGLYDANQEQAGFARIITDYCVYAYLMDVFILEQHRGIGLGKKLVEAMIQHEDLRDVRKWTLGTRDAHGLYEQFGFHPLAAPERHMERNASS